MNAPDQPFALDPAVIAAADRLEPKVIAWRRDLHQNPELGNREFRTSKLIAEHLRSLKVIEVHEKIAHTGVIGILKGGLPGPVVALRADIDALPVEEQVDVPFASRVKTEWNGVQCGVMHACGHDAHTAILMGVAEVLAGLQERIPGTVKFVFQPAEKARPRRGRRRPARSSSRRSGSGRVRDLRPCTSLPTSIRGNVGYRWAR